jgi:hypothetical protein
VTWRSPYVDIFLMRRVNDSLVEVDPINGLPNVEKEVDGLETTTVIPVDSYYPLQMYYFAGLKLYGPRTRLLKDPPLIVRGSWRQDPRNRCLMPFWNHRLEVVGTDSVALGLSTTKNFKIYLDCCLLAEVLPFVYRVDSASPVLSNRHATKLLPPLRLSQDVVD